MVNRTHGAIQTAMWGFCLTIVLATGTSLRHLLPPTGATCQKQQVDFVGETLLHTSHSSVPCSSAGAPYIRQYG